MRNGSNRGRRRPEGGQGYRVVSPAGLVAPIMNVRLATIRAVAPPLVAPASAAPLGIAARLSGIAVIGFVRVIRRPGGWRGSSRSWAPRHRPRRRLSIVGRPPRSRRSRFAVCPREGGRTERAAEEITTPWRSATTKGVKGLPRMTRVAAAPSPPGKSGCVGHAGPERCARVATGGVPAAGLSAHRSGHAGSQLVRP